MNRPNMNYNIQHDSMFILVKYVFIHVVNEKI